MCEFGTASGCGRIVDHSHITLAELGSIWQHCLWNDIAVGPMDGAVAFAHYMQYDGIVCTVVLMPVPHPVGCTVVYLYITGPHVAPDTQLGVEEIGAGIGIAPTRVEHLDTPAVGGNECTVWPQAVLPHVL